MTLFVYEYPEGQTPKFWVQDDWVYTYPGNAKAFWIKEGYWFAYPTGGRASLRSYEGFLFDHPEARETPRYYLREVEQ